MIRELKIVFAQNWPPLFVLALAAAVVASVFFFYRRAAGSVPKGTLRLLVALRVLAMLALLLCLFRPVLSFHRQTVKHAELVFLVDRSRSMSVRDYPGQPDRFQRALEALFRRGTALASVESEFRPEWFVFDADARKLNSKRELDQVTPEGEATDLAQAAATALRDRDPEDVAGVVLLTDGIDNSARDVAREIAALKVPVYPVAVGSKLMEQPNYKDIRIAKVDCRREVALNSTAEVRVYVDAIGCPNHVAQVILYENDKEVDRGELALDNVLGSQSLALRYRPKEKGEFELKVVIPPQPEERIQENNQAVFPVYVSEPKIKVLYVEGTLRSEYREVRRALEFDPNVELASFVRTSPEGLLFLQQGQLSGQPVADIPTTADQLKAFDVFILGSVDMALLNAKRLRPAEIKKFVERGGGFLMMGGAKSFGPGGYAGTEIEEILPVTLGGLDAGQEKAPFNMEALPVAASHPIFAGFVEFFTPGDPKSRMPELALLGCNIVEKAKPGATVLAVNPRRANANGPLIVLAVQPFGKGRSAALTIDSTWRWYRPLRGMGRQSPFIKFWGQLARWLAGLDGLKREGGAGVAAYTDKHFYEPGEKPRFFARVTDKEGKATPFARVILELSREGGRQASEHVLPYVEGTFGDYEVEVAGLEPGKYQGVVTALLADALSKETRMLGEARVAFRVSRPNREFESLDANEALLDRIAEATGGKRYSLLSIDQMANDLRRRSREAGVYTEWPRWGAAALTVPFAAVVALLACEWILRKRRHML